MNKHQVKGMSNQATGEVKQQVGKLTGDASTQARGYARETKGKLQKNLGDARETVRHEQRELDRRDLDRKSTRRDR